MIGKIMTPQEYNDFLKTRRTAKVFETDVKLSDSDRQLIIDAANYAPAQNSNRNFIPILVEKQEHKEWFQDNIFYMVPKYSQRLQRKMPTEYQMGIFTASAVVIYLEANFNLPIVDHESQLISENIKLVEGTANDKSIRDINIGMNMTFVAHQAYMLGYDVGFNGCTRGVRTVMETPELRKQLFDIYAEYGLSDLAAKHIFAPGYAVCIGKAVPVTNPPTKEATAGFLYKDGYYNNIKKHSLDSIENIRVINE